MEVDVAEQRGDAWSDREVEAAVDLYLRMLEADLKGDRFNKAQSYRDWVASVNPNRSVKAIERKLQNVSAVIVGLGLPRVAGLAPLSNIQGVLTDAVRRRLLGPAAAPVLDELVAIAAERAASYAADPSELVVPPPGDDTLAMSPLADIAHFDWDEAERRRLGLRGEEWVLEFERVRLLRGGRTDLADQIEHTSVEEGDGTGFDIRSFSADGAERWIEVKTTASPIGRSFYVSRNELTVSKREPDRYWLYRVFAFWDEPRMYQLRGPLDVTLDLTPTTYRARPSPAALR